MLLLFSADYFYIKCNVSADMAIVYSTFKNRVIKLLLCGVLEEVMARAGQKTEGFRVNITMEQKLRWEDAARKRDMTMSQMIREAVEMYIAVMKRQQELDKNKV